MSPSLRCNLLSVSIPTRCCCPWCARGDSQVTDTKHGAKSHSPLVRLPRLGARAVAVEPHLLSAFSRCLCSSSPLVRPACSRLCFEVRSFGQYASYKVVGYIDSHTHRPRTLCYSTRTCGSSLKTSECTPSRTLLKPRTPRRPPLMPSPLQRQKPEAKRFPRGRGGGGRSWRRGR